MLRDGAVHRHPGACPRVVTTLMVAEMYANFEDHGVVAVATFSTASVRRALRCDDCEQITVQVLEARVSSYQRGQTRGLLLHIHLSQKQLGWPGSFQVVSIGISFGRRCTDDGPPRYAARRYPQGAHQPSPMQPFRGVSSMVTRMTPAFGVTGSRPARRQRAHPHIHCLGKATAQMTSCMPMRLRRL
jgi:hypothetical protein